jgi:hypothetical protein
MVKVYKLDSDNFATNQNLPHALKVPGAIFQGINTIGLMLRMELYVDEHRWKSLSDSNKMT